MAPAPASPSMWSDTSGLTLISADWGGRRELARRAALRRQGSPSYPDVVAFGRALVAATPTRIPWSTDWPYPNVAPMPDDGDLVELLADLLPGQDQRQQVLVDNPALYPLR